MEARLVVIEIMTISSKCKVEVHHGKSAPLRPSAGATRSRQRDYRRPLAKIKGKKAATKAAKKKDRRSSPAVRAKLAAAAKARWAKVKAEGKKTL